MSISYQAGTIKGLSINEALISAWIKETALHYNKTVGEISYLFCDDEKILEVNNQYLQHDYYTDIITFDYSEDHILSGDIVISVDTVRSNSEEYNTDYEDELHRVIIHGILHLCGIDDQTTAQEQQMRAAENKALDGLKEIRNKTK